MSYFLIDETGNVKDLVTNAGLERLYTSAGPALTLFLDEGDVDDAQRRQIVAEGVADAEWDYVPKLFAELKGRVVLINGVEEEEQV